VTLLLLNQGRRKIEKGRDKEGNRERSGAGGGGGGHKIKEHITTGFKSLVNINKNHI
jgi:hypothetical protein